MKKHFPRLVVATLLAACVASGVGCYYPAYPPGNGSSAYNQGAKGYEVPQESVPPGPRYVGVDPALVIAGAAAAGLLGYAIGQNHGYHHSYYGGYYGPVYGRGYYAPRCYR